MTLNNIDFGILEFSLGILAIIAAFYWGKVVGEESLLAEDLKYKKHRKFYIDLLRAGSSNTGPLGVVSRYKRDLDYLDFWGKATSYYTVSILIVSISFLTSWILGNNQELEFIDYFNPNNSMPERLFKVCAALLLNVLVFFSFRAFLIKTNTSNYKSSIAIRVIICLLLSCLICISAAILHNLDFSEGVNKSLENLTQYSLAPMTALASLLLFLFSHIPLFGRTEPTTKSLGDHESVLQTSQYKDLFSFPSILASSCASMLVGAMAIGEYFMFFLVFPLILIMALWLPRELTFYAQRIEVVQKNTIQSNIFYFIFALLVSSACLLAAILVSSMNIEFLNLPFDWREALCNSRSSEAGAGFFVFSIFIVTLSPPILGVTLICNEFFYDNSQPRLKADLIEGTSEDEVIPIEIRKYLVKYIFMRSMDGKIFALLAIAAIVVMSTISYLAFPQLLSVLFEIELKSVNIHEPTQIFDCNT